MDFIRYWQEVFGFTDGKFCQWVGLRQERLISWRARYGTPNNHNGCIPRSHWLSEEEKSAIVDFYCEHLDDGYRRCSYMMIDQDVAYASPSAVWRVLHAAGVMRSRKYRRSSKGDGFKHAKQPHKHWHTDISYIKIRHRFYFFIAVLDGYSRSIVHWDLRESMTADDVAIVVQKARELYPDESPRIISDNGGQYTGKEFRKLITFHGLTHVTTSPYYPESNGKMERFNGSMKRECIYRKFLIDINHAKKLLNHYIDHYNNHRLHSAIGYVTPSDMLAGKAERIHAERDHKLESARKRRTEQSILPSLKTSSKDGDEVHAVAV